MEADENYNLQFHIIVYFYTCGERVSLVSVS